MTVISRHWKGIAKPAEADNYVNHLRHETFPKLSNIGGFIGASILRRATDRGTEFLIVTTWRSMEAIRQFAGEAAHVAVVPPVVQAMMVEYDKEVVHYEVVGDRADYGISQPRQ
jgi:heme-degrading monooxygenase HmoA